MTDDIAKQIAALGTQMVQRFDRVDGRLDQMDGRFDQMDGRFGAMEQRIDGVEQSLGERIGGVEQSLGERIGGLELKLDLYKEEYFAPVLQALGEGFASVNERLDRHIAESRGRSERIEREYTPIGAHRALDRRVATLEKSGRAGGNAKKA